MVKITLCFAKSHIKIAMLMLVNWCVGRIASAQLQRLTSVHVDPPLFVTHHRIK